MESRRSTANIIMCRRLNKSPRRRPNRCKRTNAVVHSAQKIVSGAPKPECYLNGSVKAVWAQPRNDCCEVVTPRHKRADKFTTSVITWRHCASAGCHCVHCHKLLEMHCNDMTIPGTRENGRYPPYNTCVRIYLLYCFRPCYASYLPIITIRVNS